MKNFNLILVATHQDELNIFKLIDSIDKNITNIKVLLVVVSQECEITYKSKNPLLVITFIDQVKMGLSKARNIALKYLSDNNLTAEYIMFPDDDSSFDENFFVHFQSVLNTDKCYITPIYNVGTKEFYIGRDTKNNFSMTLSDIRLVGSPNQILIFDKLKNQIFFDERLGVGGLYGSSEDMDLFIRLSQQGQKFIYTNKFYTFHPKKTSNYEKIPLNKIIKRFKNYSKGFAFVVLKYKLYNFIPEYLLRTLGASFFFFLKLKFKLSVAYLVQFFIRFYLLISLFSKRHLWIK